MAVRHVFEREEQTREGQARLACVRQRSDAAGRLHEPVCATCVVGHERLEQRWTHIPFSTTLDKHEAVVVDTVMQGPL